MLSRDEADRILGTLSAARDRIATAMYTMDSHPAWARLSEGAVTGETDRRRRTMRPEADLLWAYFGALRDAIERATALRSARRSSDVELSALLIDPTVGLDAAGMPVDGTGVATTTATLTDLARQTEERCAALLAQLSELDTCWSVLGVEYARAAGTVDATAALAAELGEPDVAEALRAAATGVDPGRDPLGAAPGGVLTTAWRNRFDELGRTVEQARQQLAAVVAVRDGYPGRRAGLVALFDVIAAAETAAGQARARVTEKIADPGLRPLPAAAIVLRGRLTELDALAERGQWRRLTQDLAAAEAAAARARTAADEARAAADGLLARRDELRGRLEAYRAKAVARRLAEDATLATAYVRAHDLLSTAPCDLRAATLAVHAYQTGLSQLLATAVSLAAEERTPADE